MMNRWMRGWQTAFFGIALGCGVFSSVRTSRAQDAGLEGDCTRNTHSCAQRCPTYDTCYISDDQRIYYSAPGRRFDCDGLDCAAAVASLGDYCCERGEFAPSAEKDDSGGGCGLVNVRVAPGAAGVSPWWLGASLLVYAGRRARRRGATGRS